METCIAVNSYLCSTAILPVSSGGKHYEVESQCPVNCTKLYCVLNVCK